MASLGDLVHHVEGVMYVEVPGYNQPMKVRTLRFGNRPDPEPTEPDLTMVGTKGDVLARFKEQRVKLDLDTYEMRARDMDTGEEILITWVGRNACATA